MNLTRGLAILVGASVSILPALAQEPRIEACEFVKPGMISPMEEAACTYDADGARQRMEHAYAQSLRRARRDGRQQLEQSQAAWIARRDQNCAREAQGFEGTQHSTFVLVCVADANRARARELMGRR